MSVADDQATHERAAELTERLVAGRDPAGCLELAREVLVQTGLEVDGVEGHDALVGWRGEPGEGVVLSGHVDVVPAGEGWTGDPFGASWEGDRIVARGASDMRGPVACMLAALEATEEPAGIVLTSDEETTMATARSLADRGTVDGAPLVVVGEPTGLAVATCSKGVAWIHVTCTAPSGHASTPRGQGGRGPSAAERLSQALARLPASPLRVTHPVLGSTTLAVTSLGSRETPYNVLSPEAWAKIDCRFPAPATPDEVARSVSRALEVGQGLEAELVKREPAFEADPATGDRVVRILEEEGLRAEVTGVGFASEAGHWAQRAPTVVCGPGSIDRAHQPDEHITREEIGQGVVAYRALIRAYGAR